jgi:DNA-binding MarR family transcriptional regulator
MLSWLADEGPVRASAMVERFNIDKGAISRQLQHLDELGLVVRTPDPADGRASLVAASDDARRRLADVAEHRRKWLDEQLGDWSAEELERFATTLERYNRALNA